MKKIITLSPALLLFAFLINSCSVNSTTGLITIENRTNSFLTNVRVGDTLVALSLAPGAKYDYYYYQTIQGKLTTFGVAINDDVFFDLNGNGQKDPGEAMSEVTFRFKPNYWIKISANTYQTIDYIDVSVSKQDGAVSSYSDYIK